MKTVQNSESRQYYSTSGFSEFFKSPSSFIHGINRRTMRCTPCRHTHLDINFGRVGIVWRCHGARQSSESSCLIPYARSVVSSLNISFYYDSSSDNIIGITIGGLGGNAGAAKGGLRRASRGNKSACGRAAVAEDQEQKGRSEDRRRCFGHVCIFQIGILWFCIFVADESGREEESDQSLAWGPTIENRSCH